MIPPIQTIFEIRDGRSSSTTPNAGAKEDAAAWLMRARAKSISAKTAKGAYSVFEDPVREKYLFPRHLTGRSKEDNARHAIYRVKRRGGAEKKGPKLR